MYSSIEESSRLEVINKCYWPLLKLAETVNMSTVSFDFDEQKYEVQLERFKLSDTIKGGILILTPNELKPHNADGRGAINNRR